MALSMWTFSFWAFTSTIMPYIKIRYRTTWEAIIVIFASKCVCSGWSGSLRFLNHWRAAWTESESESENESKSDGTRNLTCVSCMGWSEHLWRHGEMQSLSCLRCFSRALYPSHGEDIYVCTVCIMYFSAPTLFFVNAKSTTFYCQ